MLAYLEGSRLLAPKEVLSVVLQKGCIGFHPQSLMNSYCERTTLFLANDKRSRLSSSLMTYLSILLVCRVNGKENINITLTHTCQNVADGFVYLLKSAG